jgi:catechol 2,3-dioxygenase-like lactoylglutathione lyase family enzyme
MSEILGIHHVTVIAGDPQRNIDFYAGVLGLRLVKLTVNYDDPTTYHLYYGDGQGHPGPLESPEIDWSAAEKALASSHGHSEGEFSLIGLRVEPDERPYR